MSEPARAVAVAGPDAGLIRLLISSVRDYAIFALDAGGHIASWNAGAERIKGYTAAEIVGRHFSTFYPEHDVASGKPAWELEVSIAEGRFEEEGWRVRKDGTQFWANVVITPLWDDGRLVGFGKVTRDLTERRAAQERAIADARRVAEAEASNRAKTEFLAAMSHELRTPLNAIAGYVDLLLLGIGGELGAQQRDYLTRIRRSQQHLLAVITDLLNFSRIEAGQIAYAAAPVPLHDLVDAVLPLLAPQAASRGVALEHGPCKAAVVARADRDKVGQVVLNLLSNALKFTDAGGRVVVECHEVGDQVAITVRDTGPGIAAEQQSAIFEPFVQLGRSLNMPREGTGLGLAISRDMSRAMGGDVTVESEPGCGATFALLLPRGD